MAGIYLYPLFALWVACRLDSYEAAFPPPEFQRLCLVVIESPENDGIWRYDPDEEVIDSIPTMYKFKQHSFSTTDISKVYEDTNIDKSALLSWSKTWWWFSSKALRFSKNKSRLEYGEPHPCKFDTEGQIIWKVLKDNWGVRQVGWAQVINVIVNVECVPQHGSLSSQLKYDLPEYDGQISVYLCATWLREIEASSGVPSKATAVEVDIETDKCTLYYEDHEALKATHSGDKEYCFLKKAFNIPRFPGFYTGCQIYVEDPVFAGLWELDTTFKHNWIPFLKRRRATMDDPSSTKVTLHGGYDSASAVLVRGQLLFRLGGIVGLEIPMQWHICIGPDTGETQSIDASESQPGTIYRYDSGLDCVPFYGFAKLNYKFPGVQKYSLADNYSLRSCKEYIEAEYVFGQWKVIISTIDSGPCWAFGGGLDYAGMTLESRPNTYSCFSTKYYKYFNPVPSCIYTVEAGWLSERFTVYRSWVNVYSQYPTLRSSWTKLEWEDGYRLTGINTEYLTDFGDVNICPEKEDTKPVDVYTVSGKKVGIIYRSDANDACRPLPWKIITISGTFGTYYYDAVETMMDCIVRYNEQTGNNNWSAAVRNGSDCTIYDDKLLWNNIDIEEFASHYSDESYFYLIYSCRKFRWV